MHSRRAQPTANRATSFDEGAALPSSSSWARSGSRGAAEPAAVPHELGEGSGHVSGHSSDEVSNHAPAGQTAAEPTTRRLTSRAA